MPKVHNLWARVASADLKPGLFFIILSGGPRGGGHDGSEIQQLTAPGSRRMHHPTSYHGNLLGKTMFSRGRFLADKMKWRDKQVVALVVGDTSVYYSHLEL